MKKFALLSLGFVLGFILVSEVMALNTVSSPTNLQRGPSCTELNQCGSGVPLGAWFETSFGSGYVISNSWSSTKFWFNGSNFANYSNAINSSISAYCGYTPFGDQGEYVICDVHANQANSKSQGFLIDTKNLVVSKLYIGQGDGRPISGPFQFSTSRIFAHGHFIWYFDGTDIKQYTVSTSGGVISYTLYNTIAKPSVGFDVKHDVLEPYFNQFPTYLTGVTNNGFLYIGTDNKPYIVNENFANGSDLPYSPSVGTARAFGPILGDGYFLAFQDSGSGTQYDPSSSFTATKQILGTSHRLEYFTRFENPVAYFSSGGLVYNNTVFSWDVNCKTPGYDSCIMSGGSYKCADESNNLSPGGETCGGTVTPPTSGGGGGGSTSSGSCYIHDVESGKTLLPYRYNGTVFSETPIGGSEIVTHIRSGFDNSSLDYWTSGFKSRNWRAYVDETSLTGSLLDVLTHSSGSFVSYDSKPEFHINLYPGLSFGDEFTTDLFSHLFSTGSNTINYFRMSTDKGWHLEARLISNLGIGGAISNIQDSSYTRFDSVSGSIYLPTDKVTRDFRIVFDDSYPLIASIDWGSYTRVVSSETTCTPSILTKHTYLNGQVTTSTGQAQFSADLSQTLSTALLNQTGSIVQSEFECPKDITDLQVPGLNWTSWGFSKHVPIIDFDIDVKPFGMLECPLKSIYLFTSKFQ